MALHPAHCEICERNQHSARGENPRLIAELETGYAVLGDSQYFRGYTVFVCKHPVPDLEGLPWEFRLRFLGELALVSEAVAAAVNPHKMNVESLGNMVPHLHWHLFPRYLSEPEPLKPVWLVMPAPEDASRYAFDAQRDGELRAQIEHRIQTLRAAHRQ